MENIKKFPKSKNNRQCVGPCYKPNTNTLHPIYLKRLTAKTAYCPVSVWTETKKDGSKRKHIIDLCENPINETDKKLLEISMLLPYIDFNSNHFLKIYYNIFSFDDALIWINNNNFTPIDSRIRIISNALNAFGKKIEIIDGRFINFLYDTIKVKYIDPIYRNVSQYIGKIKDKIAFVDPENNKLDKYELEKERINYIYDTIINKDELFKFVTRYLKHYQPTWEEITDNFDDLISKLSEYITNKINLTLKIEK